MDAAAFCRSGGSRKFKSCPAHMGKADVLLCMLTGAIVGPSIVIMSQVTKTVHPFVYITISTALALPFIIALSFLFRGEGLRGTIAKRRADFFKVLTGRFIIASGLLMTFGASLTLGIRAVFLVQLEPVFVLAWSAMLLKEKVSRFKAALSALLLIGAFILTTGGDVSVLSTVLIGDLMIIAALALLSHSYLVSARLMERANPMRLYAGFSAMALLVFALLALATLPMQAFAVSAPSLALIAAASLLFNIIGFPMWLVMLKRVRPWVLASAMMVQTLAGAALSYLWLGQTLLPLQVVGGAIILISVYLIGTRG